MLSLQAKAVMLELDGSGAPEAPLVSATDAAWLPLASARVGRVAQSAPWRCLEAAPRVTLPTNIGKRAVYLANVSQVERKRYEEHGSEWLLTAPACGAVFLQQAR
jgi:hypothetical protein